jgi:hypothetical protein
MQVIDLTTKEEMRRSSKRLGASENALAGDILRREIGLPVGLRKHRFQHHRVLRHELLIAGSLKPQTGTEVNRPNAEVCHER